MNNLSGKRLLILGGSMWKDAIKRYATENNITLIATGSNQNAGIFEIADEKYSVDSTNIDEMKKLIIEKQIDGVYMGGSEPVITQACKYINELGLPCYCSPTQWEQLQDKSLFKELCIKFGLPVAQKYDATPDNLETIVPTSDFPVITKPTDGCGSSGFSKCNNIEELKKGYRIAAEASPTGSVIVEKFVKNNSVVVFYTFSNGKIYFSGLEDKYPVLHKNKGTYVAGLHVFESKNTCEFRDKFESKLQALFADIGIKEGSAWIEVFFSDGKFYFNEVGFRYSGSVSIYPVDYLYNINQVASDIYYSLTGESRIFGHRSLINPRISRNKHYCMYTLHLSKGKIKKIEGIKNVLSWDNVVFISETKNENDTILETGSISQAYAFIHFVCDTADECRETIAKLHDTVHVTDENGDEMVMKMLDTNTIKF